MLKNADYVCDGTNNAFTFYVPHYTLKLKNTIVLSNAKSFNLNNCSYIRQAFNLNFFNIQKYGLFGLSIAMNVVLTTGVSIELCCDIPHLNSVVVTHSGRLYYSGVVVNVGRFDL